MKRRGVETLQDWWTDTAAGDADKVVPKAAEYASGDLTEVGQAMARISGIELEDDAHAAELGIYFYALGKMARWTAAVEGGRRVSDDTLLDLTTYMMMSRRVRDVGGWPWADGEPPEPSPALAEAMAAHYRQGGAEDYSLADGPPHHYAYPEEEDGSVGEIPPGIRAPYPGSPLYA